MATLNAHLVDSPAADNQATVSLHIDNMPQGGGAPSANSITTAMLQNACVTNQKVERDAVGEVNIKDSAVTTPKIKDGQVTKSKLAADVLPANATKEKAGLVKQAAKVDDCAATDANGCKESINKLIKALKDAGIMASA